jgi:hypothetical protein
MIIKKLTRHDGDPIFINVALAISFRRDGDETHIHFAGADNIRVKQTPEEIVSALPV